MLTSVKTCSQCGTILQFPQNPCPVCGWIETQGRYSNEPVEFANNPEAVSGKDRESIPSRIKELGIRIEDPGLEKRPFPWWAVYTCGGMITLTIILSTLKKAIK